MTRKPLVTVVDFKGKTRPFAGVGFLGLVRRISARLYARVIAKAVSWESEPPKNYGLRSDRLEKAVKHSVFRQF